MKRGMRPLGAVLLAVLIAAPALGAGEREQPLELPGPGDTGSQRLGLPGPGDTASQRLELPAPGTTDWQPLEFPRIPKHTTYEVVDADGRPALRATSHCSASGVVLPLEGLDLAETPRLRWRWKLEHPLEAEASEREKDGDDFAARVYVTFAFVPERAGFLERARQRLGQSLYGDQIPGSAINYVWSRAEPEGAAWDNPFAESSKMVSLAQGTDPAWRVEEVDLAADYQRLFGVEAPAPLFLAVMTDTDNSCSEAQALYAGFELLGSRTGDREKP